MLKIEGMHCASCALNIEKALLEKEGVKKATVNYGMNKAYIEHDSGEISQELLKDTIASVGDYRVVEKNEVKAKRDYTKKAFLKFVIAFVLTLPIFLSMFFKFNLPFSVCIESNIRHGDLNPHLFEFIFNYLCNFSCVSCG